MAASASSLETIQKCYIAYYGRPADPIGLDYWATQLDNAGGNLTSIINAFGTSSEATTLYAGQSTAQMVNNIYLMLFNHAADVPGLTYYVGRINAGASTLSTVMLDILYGAQNADATSVLNKVAAANAFTAACDTTSEIIAYSGTTAASTARSWLATVDASTTTTPSPDTVISTIETANQTFALTAGATSVDEGSSATFTLATTNVANGTAVAYTLSGTGITAADVTGGSLTGTATVQNNTATITIGLVADHLTEGAETLKIALDNGKASSTITVNDTSLTPTYTLVANQTNVDEGKSATFTLTSSDATDTSTISYAISGTGITDSDVTGGLTGSVTLVNGVGTITVAAAADATTEGAETFTVTAASKTATTIINDTSITPVLVADSVTGTIVNGQGTAIMTPTNIQTFNDNDLTSTGAVSTGTVTVDMASAVGGQLVSLANGNTMFVADAGVRQGSFKYSDSDISGMTGTVNVTMNSAPVITSAATLAVTEDIAATGTVVATDADGDTLTYTFANGSKGTVTAGANGAYTYTPNANVNGSDTFKVTVSDGYTTTTQDIAVTIAAVNDAPALVVPAPATVAVKAGQDAVVIDLSAYATDVDAAAGTLTYTLSSTTTSKGGTITINGSTATIAYPEGGGTAALGADTFGFTVSDGVNPAISATVNLNITNTAPVSTDFALTAKTGVTQTVDLTSYVSDADSNTLTPVVTVGSVSKGGSAEVLNGKIVYTSTIGYVGTETVKYTVTDGFGGTSNEGTITFTVASNTGGTSGNDLLYGSTAAEAIDGLAGDDTINGGGGLDTITGGDGNDRITFSDGATQILGAAGNDTLVINSDAVASGFDLSLSTNQNLDTTNSKNSLNQTVVVRTFENIDASKSSGNFVMDDALAFTDNATGGDVASTTSVLTGAGDDKVEFSRATSTVTVQTNNGNDTINVEATATAKFSIDGGAGNDTVTVADNSAVNTILGGAGNDTITNTSAATGDSIDGGDGDDSITGAAAGETLIGGAGNDTITSNAGNDSITAGAGNDTIDLAGNLTTSDTIDGGDGTDTVKITTAVTAVTDLSGISNVENLYTTGNVTLAANKTGLSTITISDSGDQVVTLNTGYTAATTVDITGDSTNADKIVNSANVALTVTGNAADLDANTTITGGTGTDIIKLTADNDATGATTTLITGIETITVVAGSTATNDIVITMGTNDTQIATGKTLTVDASALTDSGATLTFVGKANETDGYLSITGGAGSDTLTGGAAADTINGGAGNDTIDTLNGNNVVDGGAGNDAITAGTGADSLTGGAGNDTFTMAGNLAATDTIGGGDGTDTLSATGTVADSLFTAVTGVEVVQSAGSTFVLTLDAKGKAAGITNVDLTNAADDVVTITSGYTSALTVNITGDSSNADKIANSANVALTVTGNAADLDAATTITGGTGTDIIKLTADNDATGATTTLITGIETITVVANTTTATNDIVITMGTNDTQIAAGKTLTVDASALTDSGATLTFVGKANETDGYLSITGGAGADTITGGAAADTINGGAGNDTIDTLNGNNVVDGGAGDDAITAGTGADSLTGGAGNDTFTMAGNLTAADTIIGGDGTDILSATGTVTDGLFAKTSTVETLTSAGSTFVATVDAFALAAGITKVDLSNAADDVVTITSGYTSALTVSITGDATNSDKIVNSANIALTVTGNAADLDATTTITGGTGTDIIKLTADNDGTGATTTLITGIETITVVAGSTATNDIIITMGANDLQIASGKTLTVDASALTDSGATLKFVGTASETNGAVSVVGGAGADSITGTAGADTISGGAGADVITGSKGLDILTGGAGADTFTVVVNSNGNIFSTISDAATGDVISFTDKGTETFAATKLSLGGTAVFQDYLNLASTGDGSTDGAMSWFQYGGNTYLVEDVSAGSSFVNGTDFVICLTGTVDLSTATGGGTNALTLA